MRTPNPAILPIANQSTGFKVTSIQGTTVGTFAPHGSALRILPAGNPPHKETWLANGRKFELSGGGPSRAAPSAVLEGLPR